MGVVHPGERNPNWHGGRSVTKDGYVLIRVGKGHHLADVRGYAYEHRVEAEKKIGRRLREGEEVHHGPGGRGDNSHGNIEVVTKPEHMALHRRRDRGLRLPGQENPSIPCACGCGASLLKFDGEGRPRRFLPAHNLHRKGS